MLRIVKNELKGSSLVAEWVKGFGGVTAVVQVRSLAWELLHAADFPEKIKN